MKPTTIREKAFSLGTWITTGSPIVAEIASQYPFDWLLIDFEHGAASEAALSDILRGISHRLPATIVRVPELNASLISRTLDWGADGIMLPHVRSAEEAANCVAAMRYPPHGNRGYSSSVRAYGYGRTPPVSPSDVRPLFFAQIEDMAGVEQVEAIAAVNGVDVLFVGPADLKLSLETADAEEKMTYEAAMQRIKAAANANKKRAGILTRDHHSVLQLFESGFSCLAVNSDVAILRSGYEQVLHTVPR